MEPSLNKKLLTMALLVLLPISTPTKSMATIDLQADLNQIVAGIRKFDANSAASTSASSIADVKRIFSNNASILREIKNANDVLRRDLISAKNYIPARDTKESPAFDTLMNLSKGYEEWLKYQNVNQLSAENCIKKSGGSFRKFSSCSISILPKTMENERIGRQKLQAAWNAWKQWQTKYGYG